MHLSHRLDLENVELRSLMQSSVSTFTSLKLMATWTHYRQMNLTQGGASLENATTVMLPLSVATR